jgi:hypothetical protein
VFQLNVKSAFFLHGELIENMYVDQLMVYQNERSDKVYKLKKALYGLRKNPKDLV